jgi:hypothetical protein
MEEKSKEQTELEVLIAARNTLLMEGRNDEFINDRIRELRKIIIETKK